MRYFLLIFLLAAFQFSYGQDPPKKDLPLPGEIPSINGRTAFLIAAKCEPTMKCKPWVWYAPTLPNLPGKAERWMFERFLEAGISIAGIDAGESYGSPVGNEIFSALHAEMTKRGYSTKPVMLGRSRGGLMTLSWAAANPTKVVAIAGIYPVCNLASYPGIEKAAGAYEMKSDELQARLKEFNPIDRLSPLAKVGVPLFAIHGDVDAVVPLDLNSGLMKERYAAAGGAMELIVPAGQGHNMWEGFFQCEELVEFVKLHVDRGVRLSLPLNRQVVQRRNDGKGAIAIEGELQTGMFRVDAMEYRLATEGQAADWRRLKADIEGARFEASIAAPQGGWYRLEVRVLDQVSVVAQTVVEQVGVGEVFVIAGQSNSANHGEQRLKPRSNRVVNFDGKGWRIANDPQPGASGEGGSFAPPLGDALVEKLGGPVAFVTCGVGATSVREWLPKGTRFPKPPTIEHRVKKLDHGDWESDGELFKSLTERMQQLGPHGFRAVLWHQGESDANQTDKTRTLTGEEYKAYLTQLIRDSRASIGWDTPWFVAQVSYHSPQDAGSPGIRSAQASLWQSGLALEGPDSDALQGDLRDEQGRGVHFSKRGLQVLAEKWKEKLIPWIEQQRR
jgi:hypothetical protein